LFTGLNFVEKAGRSVQKQKVVSQAAALYCESRRERKVRTLQGKVPRVYASSVESEGPAGQTLLERRVSQKTHIPISSKEETEK
jgi:hypothetical protein